jgi:hypothetical protein
MNVAAWLRMSELDFRPACEPDPTRHHGDAPGALSVLIRMADQLAGGRACAGREAPSLVT